MRVIVLGAAGMLGHKLIERLRTEYEIAGTIREPAPHARLSRALSGIKLYSSVDATDPASIERAIDDWKAQVVLNCIGIIKQSKAASDPLPSIAINSLLPHQLAQMAAARGARLIHFSTDCVFSGRRGNYVEDDEPDPVDLYGRSKLLGEVISPNALTLAHVDRRPRAARASGADRVVPVAARRPNQRLCPRALQRAHHAGRGGSGGLADPRPSRFAGLWQVSGEPISKFDLLQIVKRVYGLDIEIAPDEQFVCDRRLDSTRFRKHTGWRPPSWEDMITAMHRDEATYAVG